MFVFAPSSRGAIIGAMPIKWKSSEFEYHEKDWFWYGAVVIISLFLLAVAVWQANFLFIIFIIIATLMIVVWGKRMPKLIRSELGEKYLTIDGKTRDLKDFEGFYIGDDLLVLKLKGKFGSYVKIGIDGSVFDRIKKQLQKNLAEVEYQESLTDAISRRLGF